MNIEKKLESMGIIIPPMPPPVASFVPVRQMGNALYVSGQLPARDGKMVYTGKVGHRAKHRRWPRSRKTMRN